MLGSINTQNLHMTPDSTNTDNPDNHKISNHNTEERKESMEQTATNLVSFQSKANSKVRVTLEFPNYRNSEAKKAETELRNIFKNIQLEKIKKGAMQSETLALECTPQNLTEAERNG